MEFIVGRIDLGEDGEAVGWLAGLLADLNRACRTAFARSIAQNLDPRLLTEAWARGAGGVVRFDAMPTSHQESMAARHAKNLRTAATAKAQWASGHLGKLALACSKKIERIRAEIVLLSKRLGPLARRDAQRRRAKSLVKKR